MLPSTKYSLPLLACPGAADAATDYTLESTHPWNHTSDGQKRFTCGVVKLEVGPVKLPLSLTGAEVSVVPPARCVYAGVTRQGRGAGSAAAPSGT